jgi:hypothetical protein
LSCDAKEFFNWFSKAAVLLGSTAATGAAVTMALNYDLLASDHGIKPAKYPWFHSGLFNTLDHAR